MNASQEVTLHAKTHNENGAAFESISHYIADETGCVNLLHDKSHGGTYEGVWPMGPISFMIPSPMNKVNQWNVFYSFKILYIQIFVIINSQTSLQLGCIGFLLNLMCKES